MSSIIKAMTPVKVDENTIELTLKTTAQKDYIDKEFMPDMLSHLRQELSNKKVKLITAVSEIIEETTPYTDEQKFDFLADKNPFLIKLKRDFKLDLE
jgi:DNA polymerase-3 subunit gamma/tau